MIVKLITRKEITGKYIQTLVRPIFFILLKLVNNTIKLALTSVKSVIIRVELKIALKPIK